MDYTKVWIGYPMNWRRNDVLLLVSKEGTPINRNYLQQTLAAPISNTAFRISTPITTADRITNRPRSD